MRDLLKLIRKTVAGHQKVFEISRRKFYQECLEAAYRIMRVFSVSLDQDRDFFVRCHGGESVNLRYLYYPSSGISDMQGGQLGAGTHTDYGMITLLFQKDIGGLEVQDAAGIWHAVEPENNAVVINTVTSWSAGLTATIDQHPTGCSQKSETLTDTPS